MSSRNIQSFGSSVSGTYRVKNEEVVALGQVLPCIVIQCWQAAKSIQIYR